MKNQERTASAAIIAPAFAPATARAIIENQIERLILLLDLFDPDPDFEPWLAGSQTSAALDAEESCEGEGEDADREPSLGSLNAHATHDHVGWSSGTTDDREDAVESMHRRVRGALVRETEEAKATAVRLGAIISRLSGVPVGSAVRS